MLETEYKIPKVEIPDREDVERVAYCVGAYLSAFSKEPFDEKWLIDGERNSAFLLNPRTTGDFVKELLDQDGLEIISLPDGSEQVRVQKDIALNHIDKTLNDPMTEYLFSTDWISENEIVELEDLRQKIEKKDENFVDINMVYPLTDIVKGYSETLRSPESLVILGYQQDEDFDPGQKVQFLRIDPEVIVPENIRPRVVGRYLTLNSPKSEEPLKDAREITLNEIGYYLTEDEIKQVAELVEPEKYTIYLGEVAKIGSFSKNFRAIYLTGLEYLKVLTSDSNDKIEHERDYLIPEQMVYFSLEGTAVASRTQENPSESKLFKILKELLESFDVKHEETILEFPKPNNQKLVFGIIKKI